MAYIGLTTVRSPLFFLLISIFAGLTALVIVGGTSVLDDLVLSTIRVSHENNALNTIILYLSFSGDTSTLLFLSIVLTIIKRDPKDRNDFLSLVS